MADASCSHQLIGISNQQSMHVCRHMQQSMAEQLLPPTHIKALVAYHTNRLTSTNGVGDLEVHQAWL